MAKSGRGHRVIVGLAFVVIGVVFLLENLTDWNIPWGGWWPAILIVMGIWNIARKRSWCGGLALTALGVFFLMDTQDVWDYTIGDIWRFWPVILVLVGAKMLFTRRKKRSRRKKPSGSNPPQHFEDKSAPGELNITSVFGGSQQQITDQALAGGSVTSVFGATEIDLLGAALADGKATLEIYAIFGNATIRVPDNWIVDNQITNVLGGVEDRRDSPPSEGAAGSLTLTGVCLFGGVGLES